MIKADSTTITLNAGLVAASDTITGNSDTITVNGNGNSISVSGTGETINASNT